MSEFFRTHMGHKFYEQTMPELVKQLSRLNDNLERLLERLPGAGGDEENEQEHRR